MFLSAQKKTTLQNLGSWDLYFLNFLPVANEDLIDESVYLPSGRPKMVEFLTSNIRNVQRIIEDGDIFGRTALHLAALHGHQNDLLLLLNAKANPGARDNSK